LQNTGMVYGYARVSTDGQSVAAQVQQLVIMLHGGGLWRCGVG